MTNATNDRVVRRSALEADHLALGARWRSEDVHWPEAYTPSGAAVQGVGGTIDAGAVAGAAGLAEIGPLDELLLRGPGAIAAAARLADISEASVGHVATATLGDEGCVAWLLGPDEVLLVASVGDPALAKLAAELASDDVSAIDMSGARTSLRLAGPVAPAILSELCPADTTPTTMAPADLVQAPLAGVRAFIAREDMGGDAGYTIMVARDEAAYVWNAILRIGRPHGLLPVGPAAVAVAAEAPTAR